MICEWELLTSPLPLNPPPRWDGGLLEWLGRPGSPGVAGGYSRKPLTGFIIAPAMMFQWKKEMW